MIHVVLGMHKSGTTLVSELLHHAGIDMVDAADPDTSYDHGNKWERDSTKQVNHAILGSAGTFSLKTVGYQRRFEPAEQGADAGGDRGLLGPTSGLGIQGSAHLPHLRPVGW